MTYRRLPNTDLARIRALENAIEKEGARENNQLVLSYKIIQDARNFLEVFKRNNKLYNQCYEAQIKSSKKYQNHVKTIRIYISHFLQVLNMAVIRSEIKKENKLLYGLDINDYTVPDLSSEAALLKWGECIIKGEDERLKKGGVPIYNPTIAKVKVHYNIFKESYVVQKDLQSNTNKHLDVITKMRPKADEIILDIWNQIEDIFKDYPSSIKLEKCKSFGVVYYLRTKEKKAIEAEKLQKKIDFE